MNLNRNLSAPPIESSRRKHSTRKHLDIHNIPLQKTPAVREIVGYVSRRLYIVHFYLTRLTIISDIMSCLAISSIILMIVENELTFNCIDNQDTKVSWSIKLIITITTIILLALILYYHYLNMKFYAFRNSIRDWRVQVTSVKIFSIMIEFLICSIHPMPRSYPYINPERINSTSFSDPYSLSYTAIDVGLGLPMFLRLYLLGRTIKIHSKMIRNPPLRLVGYLNHVTIDPFFLIKSYLLHRPMKCFLTIVTLVFLIGSWSLRACNYTSTREHVSMSDSMWLFVVTFTTIGYGDQYPSTYCGRSIATIIGLSGLSLTAIYTAILSQKLLLNREEKYVHTFVLDADLHKIFRNQAANVIQFAIKDLILKRQNKLTSIESFQVQRRLFQSILAFQTARKERNNLIHSCAGFRELMNVQHHTNEQNKQTMKQIENIQNEIKEIKDKFNNLNNNMNILLNKLNGILNFETE
ncbi:unnamed protein product [Adineta ricciae]|uniref:Potassium channel domain-containing protein n=1 Tax=Adineta ricciae TaxID=249248 RepID=A0A815GXA9_ADIRI|nr:unnamed protein product [Adineta ricciae]CAF1346323.1 unnamed protein product [Adineta ricciae]